MQYRNDDGSLRGERDRDRGERLSRDYRDEQRDHRPQSGAGHDNEDYPVSRGRGWGDNRPPDYGRYREAERSSREPRGYRGAAEEGYGYAPRRSDGGSEFDSGGSDFGRRDFRPEESPPYFGTGNYSSGGSGLGGGLRGMQGMGAYGPSGGRYNAEYGNPAEGSYVWSGADARDERRPGGEREHHRGWLGRFFGRGPKGYKRSDERLREDISERLLHSGSIDASDVTVTVTEAVVTLEGTVPERHMKHDIENIADACMGVQDVDNRVRVQRRNPGWEEPGTGAVQTASAGATAPAPGATPGVRTKSN